MGSLFSSAPTVVAIEVWTNCPATPMIGPLPQGNAIARSRSAGSAAAIGLPAVSRTVTSARPVGFELIESQCGAVDHIGPVQDRQRRPCRSTVGNRSNVCGPSPSRRRICGPAPRSIATIVGCAGNTRGTRGQASVRRPRWAGQFHRQRRWLLELHVVLRRRPRGAHVTVGGGVGRTQHVDQIGIADRAGGSRGADQIGQLRTLPCREPTPSVSPRWLPARSGCGCMFTALLGRERHGGRAADARRVLPRSPAGPAARSRDPTGPPPIPRAGRERPRCGAA